MHVGFIVTSPYQLYHFEKIANHLVRKTFYIEVRDQDFGLSKEKIQAHVPDADIRWIGSRDLLSLDGQCDVFVCHTPVPLMKFFEKSLTVAQQYSLAKEKYQYGIWRSQANLNLMYGKYSERLASPFAHCVAAGNPMLDGAFPGGAVPEVSSAEPDRLRVLYMPTYGDLSDKGAVIRRLRVEGLNVTVKTHHADQSTAAIAEYHNLPIHFSDSDPVALIQEHDLVVSDYSGAIYDALAIRSPVVVVGDLNEQSKDVNRLSARDHEIVSACQLPGSWNTDESFWDAYEYSRRMVADEQRYRDFLDTYFVNLGSAGEACAAEIERIWTEGEPYDFAVTQVREAQRAYVRKAQSLRSAAKKSPARDAKPSGLSQVRNNLKIYPPSVLALKSMRWVLDRIPGGQHMLQGLRKIRAIWKPADSGEDMDDAAGAEQPKLAKTELHETLPVVPALRRAETLRLLEREFERYNVKYRKTLMESKVYCAVGESGLDDLTHAIRSFGRLLKSGRAKVWLGSGTAYNKTRRADSLRLADVASADSLVVGVPYRNEGLSYTSPGGVEILILEGRDQRLVARRWRAEKVDWTADFRNPTEDTKSNGQGDPSETKRHALQSEPIDIVYTWVDSTDEEWRAEKADWARRENIELNSSDNDERFENRDELRYSLRSVWLYAPFVRNIYIVTAGQTPSWLNVAHERVHVVSHEDIFPDKRNLPTFNSHAIEACLHRIPGLSENFLYFNDDVFLGRETTVDTYFTKAGLIRSRFSPTSFGAASKPDPTAIPTAWASFNAIRLVEESFGLHFVRQMKHVPMPMKRSLLEEIAERYPDEVAQTQAARFRSRSDLSLPSMLGHYYGIATNRAVEAENVPGEYVYADTGRKDFTSRLRLISKKNPAFFCLNVTLHTEIELNQQKALLDEFLHSRFPVASEYEISLDQVHGYELDSESRAY